MKNKPIKNLAASVHQRLLDKARQTGRPFNELLQYFVMERFLYRLSKSKYAKNFVLKGALMLNVWERTALPRPTLDIDVLAKRIGNDVESVVRVVQEICTQAVEPDGITFDPARVRGQQIAEEAEYEGVRVRLGGSLGNARLSLQLDVGFGDVVIPAEEVMDYPTILDFPAPHLRGYSKESVVAEKFEAAVRHGDVNSRMKDFYDIWFLSRQFEFDGATLAEAAREVFSRRGTELSPEAVSLRPAFAEDPSKAAQWHAFRNRNRLDAAPENFVDLMKVVVAFLKPVAAAVSTANAFGVRWTPPGPWMQS